MGCFSWLCKECGKGILSSSFDGQECILFLLKDGVVIEVLRGRYDSYGRVFKDETSSQELRVDPIGKPDDDDNGLYEIWQYGSWHQICDLEFSGDPDTGIAAFHKDCYEGVEPTVKSKSDPNQGWGENFENFANLGKVVKDD